MYPGATWEADGGGGVGGHGVGVWGWVKQQWDIRGPPTA